jgi:hypothetical protein
MNPSQPPERPLRPNVVSRVIRKGASAPALDDLDATALTPEQRIDAVWTLTKACAVGWASPTVR